ncbi:phage holin family protein [Providencia rettgeri]|uniref:phage holin family protein n=1 Tax=Providencia rettgeri TaxID=587 RepID=UPI001EF6F01F|nr:phage holin family protein [Providencia rettgeri]MDM9281808.1 phage holin family protein [Providencia rettgeri]UYV40411.1 phage holin family protein [Providencia rettgeri]
MRMPYKDPNNINWLTIMLVGFMTILGSIASYANKLLKGETFRFWVLIAQVIVSVFAGALVLLASSYYMWQPEIAGGIAGMAGWSGAAVVGALERQLIKKVENE